MKLSLLIISLAICNLAFSQFGPIFGPDGEVPNFEEENIIIEESFSEEEITSDGYTSLNVTEAMQDPQIQGFLFIGVQYVVQQGIQNGDLPNSFYQVSEVYSIETQEEDGVNYRFYVELSDNQQNGANVTFVVNYQEETGQTEVTSYSFGDDVDDSDDGWTDLDVSEAQSNPAIQGYLYSGIQYVVQQGISEGTLPNAFYQISQVYSIASRETTEGEDYKFEVGLTDGQTNNPEINFIVSRNNATGSTQVTEYTIGDGTETETPPTEETEEVIEEETEFPTDDYTPLDPSLIQTDPKFQSLLAIGVRYLVENAIQDGKLPETFNDLSGQVNTVETKTENNLEYYRFGLGITDNQGTTANGTFELIHDPISNITQVTSYTVTNVTTGGPGPGPEPGNWESLDLQQVSQDQTLLQIGASGLLYVIEQGVNSGIIPNSNYQPTTVYSVEQQTATDGVNYRWNLEFADGAGNSARVQYIVFYNPTAQTVDVIDYEFLNVITA